MSSSPTSSRNSARNSTRSSNRRTGRRRDEAAEPRSTRRIGKPAVWTIVGVVVVAVAVVVGGWFTPIMSVRETSVQGLVSIPEEQVLAALAIDDGRPLLRVDTNAAARRVAQLPKVASVRVQRVYPSTVRVTVTERAPIVFFDSPQGTHLLDATGVDYAIEPPPPGVPRLKVDNPGAGDPTTQAVLAVLAATPPPLRLQVGEVVATSISDITLNLLDGRVIVWGSQDDSQRKSDIALPLLTQPGRIYDVSSPDLPTVR